MSLITVLAYLAILGLADKVVSVCQDPYEVSLTEQWTEFCFDATRSVSAFPEEYKDRGLIKIN